MQNVKLNLIPGSVMPVVNVSQYDKARQFSLTVYEGASQYSLTGKSVQIRGTKPDGNGFAYDSTDGVVSVSGSTVTISTTQQMTAVGGQTMAELRITQSGVILGTLNFILMVEPSALSDDTPISDTDIPAIERDFEAALAEAEADALKAEGYAVGTQDGTPAQSGEPYYQDNAKYYKEQAEAAASGGGADALKAEGYAVGTQNGVPVTSESPYYHNNAAYYEGEASTSATNAAASETNAGLSETAAGNSATSAASDALVSEGWAVGKQNGTPVSSGSPYYQNNAEYYKDQAAQYAAGGLIFKGSVAFASIPTTGMANGDMYNITDDFTTDSRFIEGAGVSVKAGADIAWVAGSVNKWDILALGGGSDDYSQLINKPQINSVELNGNKTPADLGLATDAAMTGASAGSAGAKGLVPAPAAGDNTKFLRGDGTWAEAGGGGGGGFDYKDWLTAGDLNPMSYADLAAVLADEEAVRRLMTIHLAVDYLAGQTAVDASINTILTSDICAKWINLRDYALDTLYDNALFKTVMDAAGKYFLGEWVKLSTSPETWGPKGNVPIMTSNTAPYGTASAYKVFDGNASTTASGTDFSYNFVNPICPKDFICKNASGQDITGGTLQASNDGSTWVTPVNGKYYLNLRVHFAASTTVATVQFYGRELKVSVPVMTSNTAPYGKVISNLTQTSGTTLYDVFNPARSSNYSVFSYNASRTDGYVGYRFTRKVLLKEAVIKSSVTGDNSNISAFTVLYSDDGSTWNDASERVTGAEAYNQLVCTITETEPHEYWVIGKIKNNGNAGNFILTNAQFYGLDYSEYDWDADNPRHYLYDHGVEPNETLTTFGTNGSTLIADEKLGSELYGYRNSGSDTVGWKTATKVDFSSYNLLRIVGGMYGSTNQADTDYYMMVIGEGLTWDTRNNNIATLSIKSALPNDYPNTSYIDVSSISESYTASFMLRSGSVVIRDGSIKEWWVE